MNDFMRYSLTAERSSIKFQRIVDGHEIKPAMICIPLNKLAHDCCTLLTSAHAHYFHRDREEFQL